MSRDDAGGDVVRNIATGLRAEIVDVDWSVRIQTVALATGLLAFGVALGVRWAAVDTINYFGPINPYAPPPEHVVPLSKLYNQQMRLALAVAAVGLLAGVGMGIHGRRGESR
jgi:hypothetical protein